MMTGDAHVLIVCWILPASKSLLIVLSPHGLNFNGMVYGTDMHGSPSVGISTGGYVDVPTCKTTKRVNQSINQSINQLFVLSSPPYSLGTTLCGNLNMLVVRY